MTSIDTGRAEARARANRRLHRITIGTALAAVAATGGFGWLAAARNGTSTTGTLAVISTTGSTDAVAPTTATTITGSTSATAAPSAATASPAPVVTTTQGGAVASTGGS